MRSLAVVGVLAAGILPVAAAVTYQPNFESLARHQAAPEWLEDAKLGIYFHWGVYSVPAYGSEWYPRNMHIKTQREYKHHLETYGDPTQFGYPDFVPRFKAEHFDAEAWADLFVRAGARFAGPVAEHHDGFSMWDSAVTPWNARDRGPRRDITGELSRAIRARGLRFITTFHHARNSLWEKTPGKWSGHYEYVKKNFPTLLNDPERAILYGYMPRADFLAMWKAKLVEVIDQYQPDIIWFDSWLDEIPESVRAEFAAYYLNQAERWGREVAIVRKQQDLPLSFSMNDHEKSREPKALPDLWMTDDTVSTGSWCYTQDLKIKSLSMVLHSLIDTVAKHGVMLLNISPQADGTIPADQRNVLLALGDWLRLNGQAIYGTRPWVTAAEGPTAEPAGGFKSHREFLKLRYSAQDVRYTRSKDGRFVYAIVLGWPGGGQELVLQAFAQGTPGGDAARVRGVRLIGSAGPLHWQQESRGLVLTTPETPVHPDAIVFAISVAP